MYSFPMDTQTKAVSSDKNGTGDSVLCGKFHFSRLHIPGHALVDPIYNQISLSTEPQTHILIETKRHISEKNSAHYNMAAGVKDQVIVQLYWGGQVDQSGAPFELRYTIPPKTSVHLPRRSAFFDILATIRRAMGHSHCILNLTGRLLVNTKGSSFTHVLFPIVSDESWHYFIEQTSRVGELQVYVTPIFAETTDMSFTELLTGIIQSSGGLDENHITFGSNSTHFGHASNIIESSHGSNLESEGLNVRRFNMSDFKFVNESDNPMTVKGQLGKRKAYPRVPNADIPFYHAPVTFRPWYPERDDESLPIYIYSPTENILEVRMVFSGFNELKNAVTLYHLKERKQFRTKHKKSRRWKAVCVQSQNKLQPCFWALSASQMYGSSGGWQIKKFCILHTCRVDTSQGNEDVNCTSEIIANLVREKLRVDSGYKVKHIQMDVKSKFGIDVSYRKAWYARQRVIKSMYGNFGHSENCQEQNYYSWDISSSNSD